eukprot:1382345-Rhodomonas_salina.1
MKLSLSHGAVRFLPPPAECQRNAGMDGACPFCVSVARAQPLSVTEIKIVVGFLIDRTPSSVCKPSHAFSDMICYLACVGAIQCSTAARDTCFRVEELSNLRPDAERHKRAKKPTQRELVPSLLAPSRPPPSCLTAPSFVCSG